MHWLNMWHFILFYIVAEVYNLRMYIKKDNHSHKYLTTTVLTTTVHVHVYFERPVTGKPCKFSNPNFVNTIFTYIYNNANKKD